jgi:hypothetical protein
MAMVIVSTVFVLIICLSARRANTHFWGETHLPMQWGLTGQVNWSASRRFALAFVPIVAVVVLGFQTILAMTVPPRAGQEDLVLPVLLGSGVALVAVQFLHFGLIAVTLRRKAG